MIKLKFDGSEMTLSLEDAEGLVESLEAEGVEYQWEDLDPQAKPAPPDDGWSFSFFDR